MRVYSSHSFWISSSLDVPAGVTQEEGHTGFFIHLPSAARALTFLGRRIQPFLSLVDREVDFLCTNDLIVLHSLGFFFFLVRKIQFTGIELTSQRVRRLRGYPIKAALYTIVPRSPFFASCTPKYCRLQKCGWMSASMKWRYLGHFQLLSKAVAAMAEMEVSPQEEMANPQGSSPLRDLGFLKISCLFLLCVEV